MAGSETIRALRTTVCRRRRATVLAHNRPQVMRERHPRRIASDERRLASAAFLPWSNQPALVGGGMIRHHIGLR